MSTTVPSPAPAAAPAARPFASRSTVVVVTRDRVRDLEQALGHLTALPEHPRIVLADNASTDGTVAMVRARFPEVDVLALPENVGAVGRNRAIERVTTPYVAFADDDSWWEPGSLDRAADVLDAHPRLALLNAHILVGPEDRDDPTCLEMAESPIPPGPDQPGVLILSFIGCGAIVRRDAFLEAGGFHWALGIGGEEELLSHDLVGAGWQLSYLPELVVHHHASKTRDVHGRRAHGIRNTLWTVWLRRPLGPALVRTGRLIRRLPRDRVTLRGLWAAAKGAPWVLRERRVASPHVEAAVRLLEDQQLDSGTRRYVS